MQRPPVRPTLIPIQAKPAGGRSPATSSTRPGLSEADLFEPIREGHTGRVCINSDVQLAAVTRLINDRMFAEARQELQSLFAVEPNNFQARILWLLSEARQLADAHQQQEAVAKYQQLLQLEPKHGEAAQYISVNSSAKQQGILNKLFG